MTVASTTSRMPPYVGNGTADTFAYTFKILDDDDLRVIVVTTAGVETVLTKTTHYTLTGVGEAAGGNVVLVNGGFAWQDVDGDLATGYSLVPLRVPSMLQESAYADAGRYAGRTAERDLDRAAMRDLWLQDQLARSLRLPESEAGTVAATALPAAADRASQFLAFDASGNPIAAAALSAATPASAYIQTLLDDADAATARQTLGGVPKSVATIAALKALVGTSLVGDVIVEGYAAAGDGGGGLFRWVAADASTDNAGTIIAPTVGAGRWFRVGGYTTVFSAKAFGAKADGATNDTVALAALSAAVNAAGGGDVLLEPGTYIVGAQTFAAGAGHGYAYLSSKVLWFSALTKGLRLSGYGAKLKVASGLKFGSFDPTTGLANAPALPNNNTDYRSAFVRDAVISVQDCTGPVEIEGVEIDGNMSGLSLGGQWGDTGYQIEGSGIYLGQNNQATVRNVYTHHNALDGVYARRDTVVDSDPDTPVVLINVRSEYNARQGFSWVGGNGVTAIGCKFNHTGQATFISAPAAGVDVEPGAGMVCRHGMFLGCEFINNGGAGYLSDSGDSADIVLQGCTIWGTSSRAVWPKMPRTVFRDCRIYGYVVNAYSSVTNPQNGCVFERCRFSDEVHPIYGATYAASYTSLLDLSSGAGVKIRDCSLVASAHVALRVIGDSSAEIAKATIDGLRVHSTWDGQVNGATQGTLNYCRIRNLLVTETYASPPATGYRIDVAGNTVDGMVYFNTTKLKYGNAATGPVGHISDVPDVGWNTATINAANLASGAEAAVGTITVTGAAIGDRVDVTVSVDLQGLFLWGWVSAADTVSIRLRNGTAGAIDLASAVYTAVVRRKSQA